VEGRRQQKGSTEKPEKEIQLIMSKQFENALESAGITISDTPPTFNQEQNDVPETVADTPLEPVPNQEPVQQTTPETTQAVSEPQAQPSKPVQESVQEAVKESEPSPDVDVDAEVLRYLSEKLGSDVSSFDAIALANSNIPVEIDERVQAINDFVQKTGRSPEDWYKFQQLNPSEMDDFTAVRNQMVVEHGNLTTEEVNMLLESKYKLDEDRFDESETKMAKLQLKMDAESARKTISNLRDDYMLPVSEEGEVQSPITEDWMSAMQAEVKDFDGLVFELPTGENFTFGINEDYRKELASKNSKIENHFDDYVFDDGEWNYEKLNAHRAVIDNIDSIVRSVYQQGMSDGQRKVVENAANVTNQPNQRDTSQQTSGLDEQIINAFGGSSTMTFKI